MRLTHPPLSYGHLIVMGGTRVSARGGRTGVWLIGSRGSVATTTVVGVAALALDLVEPTGLVTSSEAFDGVPLPEVGDLVFGGHDVVTTPLAVKAAELAEAGAIPQSLLPA